MVEETFIMLGLRFKNLMESMTSSGGRSIMDFAEDGIEQSARS